MQQSTFKNDFKIKIKLNTTLKGKAPATWTRDDWRRYNVSFKETLLTPYQFAAQVWQGFSFTPLWNRRRREENFIEAWHMAFDFDSSGASLDYLMRQGSIADYFASFAYSTPSSTPDNPKSRVVFVFEHPIKNSETFRELYQAIAWYFEKDGSKTDPACKDSLRLYYGSPSCEVRGNWAILTTKRKEHFYNPILETIEDDDRPSQLEFFTNSYKAAHPEPPPLPERKSTYAIAASDDEITKRIESLLDRVVNAPDGEKHTTLNKASYTMGGLVAGGYITMTEAKDALYNAIVLNGGAKDLKAAERTIEVSLTDGIGKPLAIEAYYKRDIDDIL